jgi:nitrilase
VTGSPGRRVVVAAAHAAPILLDTDATIDKACALIAEAGRLGVGLLVFPEVFVPGFPYWINCYPPDEQWPLLQRYVAASIALPGPELERVQRAARDAHVHVVLGASEREGSTLYNAQAFIDDQGRYLGKHRKLQPTFAERYVWGQGDGSTMQVYDTSIGALGGLVCWEHVMNLARHTLALKGEEIHAASWPGLETQRNMRGYFDVQVEALSRAQALSSQCFVVVAASPVTEQMIDVMHAAAGEQAFLTPGGGWSAVVHPMASLVAGPHTGLEERLVVAEIDLDEIGALKLLADVGGHASRREVMRLVIDETPHAALVREHPQPGTAPQPLGDGIPGGA